MSSDDQRPLGPATRRDFLRKVGMYGAPTMLAGGALLETAARAVAAGSETSLASSVATSEAAGSSSTSIGGIDPLQTLEADLATLEGLAAPNGLLGRLELADAIAALKAATAAANWVDDWDLVPKRGALVYAALALMLIAHAPSAVGDVISDLVNVAATLANTAIQDASTVPAAASRAYTSGTTAAASGNYVVAIVDYGVAWGEVTL